MLMSHVGYHSSNFFLPYTRQGEGRLIIKTSFNDVFIKLVKFMLYITIKLKRQDR